MAEPDWNPDTGGRSLAEILREAGIESAARAGKRRRWDDPEEAGLRQRRAEAAADTAAERAGYGRRKSDHEPSPAPPMPELARESRPPRRPAVDPPRRPAADPSTAAIPGLRPDRKPGVPTAPAAEPERRGPDRRSSDRRLSDRAPQRARAERPVPVEQPVRDERPARKERPLRNDPHPSTGPIPVVRADDLGDADLDTSPKESALAWLRFAGELVIALAVGIGVYFAATVLWENVPYVAVVLVPIAVTGLVTGVGAWRARMGREPVGAWLLAVLVLAGTLLAIVPAASVIVAKG